MHPTRADAIAIAFLIVAAGLILTFGFGLWSILPPAIVLFALMADGVFRPASPWFMPLISHGPRNSNKVALTFDDGPDPEVTPKILDLLREHRARATFFVIARHVEQHPALARRIVDEGHEIGNHTYAHPRLFNTRLTRGMLAEMQRAQQVLGQQLGITPRWFRPPVGLKNPHLPLAARKLDLRVVMWSRHARDTLFSQPEHVARRVLKRIRAGDIVALHDGHDRQTHGGGSRTHTVHAVGQILDGLQTRGLACVSVGELIRR